MASDAAAAAVALALLTTLAGVQCGRHHRYLYSSPRRPENGGATHLSLSDRRPQLPDSSERGVLLQFLLLPDQDPRATQDLEEEQEPSLEQEITLWRQNFQHHTYRGSPEALRPPHKRHLGVEIPDEIGSFGSSSFISRLKQRMRSGGK